MKKDHIQYYIFETIVLGLGFFISSSFDQVRSQTLGIIAVVLLYAGMGLIHHKIDHDIHFKIVLEYVLISILIVSVFIFVQSGIV